MQAEVLSSIMSATDLDSCLELVADRRRRNLIHQLRQNGNEQTTIDTLVDRLNRGERAAGKDRPPNREGLAIQVYHTHLPKLADHGVIEYDPERGTVQYLSDERLEAVVDSLPREMPRPGL
jgi:DNA-binding transcriptional ArsR family regulator